MSIGTRLLVAVIAALSVVAALVALADATKFGGQPGRPGDQTVVRFAVDTKRYREGNAATALWYTCVGTVGREAGGSPAQEADGRYRSVIRPALGEDGRRRFRGCIHDATIDRVRGRVVSMVNELESGGRPPG